MTEGDFRELTADILVTPGNSFGWMDGGFDAACREFFGAEIENRVRGVIQHEWGGLCKVGDAFIVETRNRRFPLLCYAPTMLTPGTCPAEHAQLAFKAALAAAGHLHARSLASPGLCTGAGQVPARTAAKAMRAAWDESFGVAAPASNRHRRESHAPGKQKASTR